MKIILHLRLMQNHLSSQLSLNRQVVSLEQGILHSLSTRTVPLFCALIDLVIIITDTTINAKFTKVIDNILFNCQLNSLKLK